MRAAALCLALLIAAPSWAAELVLSDAQQMELANGIKATQAELMSCRQSAPGAVGIALYGGIAFALGLLGGLLVASIVQRPQSP